ncbi:MAG: ribonuclease E/G [Tissierellia bacterium]|nr:ribonuclease E/G [Tissierellia bacterium]
MHGLFIESFDGNVYIFALENDELVEYHSASELDQSLVGNIYRSRINNIETGLDAAFINIGELKNGYLYLMDKIKKSEYKSGQTILCQVLKDGAGMKGPKLTDEITLQGDSIVYIMKSDTIIFSSKITEKATKKRFIKLAEEHKGCDEGILFRSKVEEFTEEYIIKELNFLRSQARYIEKQRDFLPVPKLIYKPRHPMIELMHKYLKDEEFNVIITDEELKEQIENKLPINAQLSVSPYDSIKYHSQWWKTFKQSMEKKVPLIGGGEIIIEYTEAMTVIDVNSARDVNHSDLEAMALEINKAAAKEIAKQIRLRNLSGIIIVDFIQMKPSGKKELECFFKDILKTDPNPANFVDFTELGLVELTRKRKFRTINEQKADFSAWFHN